MTLTYEQRVAVRERWSLHAKRALSYLRNVRDSVYEDWDGMRVTTSLPNECWSLIDMTLEVAHEIVERLPDHYFTTERTADFLGLVGGNYDYNASDDWYEAAQKLVALIEKRREGGKMLRRIAALEATAGRTPEEAAAYRLKARQLRERM